MRTHSNKVTKLEKEVIDKLFNKQFAHVDDEVIVPDNFHEILIWAL